ncbi:transferase [Kangiella sp.]|uniref:transferase n=1 Tax=Kangiella sp. TaxID=1920245 RepID=UPI003A8CA62E
MAEYFFVKIHSFLKRIRSIFFFFAYGVRFKIVGTKLKIRGVKYFSVESNVSIGDFCWVECISSYLNFSYNPVLRISDNVAMSDFVHISCSKSIVIEKNVLIGSKVYIGDHSHGYGPNQEGKGPANLPLINLDDVYIGESTWIGDGVVILAGTHLNAHSVIVANSVVKNLRTNKPAIIGGSPAKIIKYLG